MVLLIVHSCLPPGNSAIKLPVFAAQVHLFLKRYWKQTFWSVVVCSVKNTLMNKWRELWRAEQCIPLCPINTWSRVEQDTTILYSPNMKWNRVPCWTAARIRYHTGKASVCLAQNRKCAKPHFYSRFFLTYCRELTDLGRPLCCLVEVIKMIPESNFFNSTCTNNSLALFWLLAYKVYKLNLSTVWYYQACNHKFQLLTSFNNFMHISCKFFYRSGYHEGRSCKYHLENHQPQEKLLFLL